MGATTDNDVTPLRVAPRELRELLDTLDASSQQAGEVKEGRRSRRIPFRSLQIVVYVVGRDSDGTADFQVQSRNISAHGLSFLHKHALAPGQRLKIDIPVMDDRVLKLSARVTRCRYLKNMLHEVGVEFLASRKR